MLFLFYVMQMDIQYGRAGEDKTIKVAEKTLNSPALDI